MSTSEIDTSVFRILSDKRPHTTSAIVQEIRKSGASKISESEVFEYLLKAEALGRVKRERTAEFDENRPVATSSWTLIGDASVEIHAEVASEPYVKNCMIVVSQPTWLSLRGVQLGKLGFPVLNVREAMQKVVLDAKEELRIACPYYDDLFIEVLSADSEKVKKLKSVTVLAENMDPFLLKAKKLFPNIVVKTLYDTTGGGQDGYKVQGVHAKLMIADSHEVLVGSFNFRFSHVYYNIDTGLLATGPIVQHYVKIFDSIKEAK